MYLPTYIWYLHMIGRLHTYIHNITQGGGGEGIHNLNVPTFHLTNLNAHPSARRKEWSVVQILPWYSILLLLSNYLFFLSSSFWLYDKADTNDMYIRILIVCFSRYNLLSKTKKKTSCGYESGSLFSYHRYHMLWVVWYLYVRPTTYY